MFAGILALLALVLLLVVWLELEARIKLNHEHTHQVTVRTDHLETGAEKTRTQVLSNQTEISQLQTKLNQTTDEWEEYKGCFYTSQIQSVRVTIPENIRTSEGDLLPKVKAYLLKNKVTKSFAYTNDADLRKYPEIYTLTVPGFFAPNSENAKFTIYSLI